MAGGSLLTLIDDIATVLDDITVLSKTAAKQTAGVLGDDLALNAEQVSGIRAEREIPVVWAVAKGSFRNKLILVPSALLITAVAPALIVLMLLAGGLYLCFEGAEKIAHYFHRGDENVRKQHTAKIEALADPEVDLVEFEESKIKAAIRTDFVLSAEIVVIVLGIVQGAPFMVQVGVVTALAFGLTVGVYGFVAGLVKVDDVGLYLTKTEDDAPAVALKRFVGRGLLAFAPIMMKMLSLAGTVAMFLVGGGIFVHNIGAIHHLVEPICESIGIFGSTLVEGCVGLSVGFLSLWLFSVATKLFGERK